MRIGTYNINSVRLRIQRVVDLLREENLDILCLQETKCEDKSFPIEAIKAAGYEAYFSGQKSYNGVCIISSVALSSVQSMAIVNEDKRHISAQLEDGTIIHNFYIPAGGDEPDIEVNPKFAHKLDFVDAVAEYFRDKHSPSDKVIILGDFNIAPYENDVWSHKQLLKVVSHTAIEVERLEAMRASIGFVDIAREFVPASERVYSWWSYRNRDWRKSNRGRRLDHIWATASVDVKAFCVLPDLRDGEKPSDHVPVIVDI